VNRKRSCFDIAGSGDEYKLHGGHDVDKQWINQVQGRNDSETKPKIVPRFQMSLQTEEQFVDLMKNKSTMRHISSLIVQECKLETSI
jgi:hypothetical protein